jgi:N utilization substance protein A
MPSKKKKITSKKRKSKTATAASKKKTVRTKKKQTVRTKRAANTKAAKKQTGKAVQTKKASRASRSRKRRQGVNADREIKQDIRSRNLGTVGTVSGRQSGDLQGLSRAEQADSESVDELVEEGNIFEAGAVAGVEEADNADEREVHTHEVPEDDVPEEYLDKE